MLEDIELDNVRVGADKTTDTRGGYYDDRPLGMLPGGVFLGIHTNRIAGIHAEFARGLTLRDTQVIWGDHRRITTAPRSKPARSMI